MKNRLLVTVVWLVIFSAGYSGTVEFMSFGTEAKGIKIQINPKLELFHIMAYLSDSRHLNDLGLPNTLINKVLIMDSLIKAVDSFAKKAQFDRFLETHQLYYKQKIAEVSAEVSGMDMIKDFESFWGIKKDRYKVVIVMLEQDVHATWFTQDNETN